MTKAILKNNESYLEIKKIYDEKYYPKGAKRGCYRNFIERKIRESLQE